MSNNKPKLSDVAKQNNTARVSKFATTMVPAPPVQPSETTPTEVETVSPFPPADLSRPVNQEESETAERESSRPPTLEPQAKTPVSEPALPVKSSRKRGNQLSLDDILTPKAPDKEGFPKIARISEKHHDLLRMIAYEQKKPMNTILYNLLEALDQAYQRDQSNPQNHA